MRPLSLIKQKGQVLIIVALALPVLIGTVGLAIDSGLGYLIKAKLNAAVDSASIAAARAVTQGTDQATQRAAAQQAAREFFAVNYPTGYLGSTPTFNDPTVTFDMGKVTVDATATAVVPVTLMRVLRFNLLNVVASGQAVRRDLDMSFVVDTSGSMSSRGSTVRQNAQLFLTKFNVVQDRIALIHFAYGAIVDDQIKKPPNRGFNRTLMNQHIGSYSFSGSTNSAEGFWHARDQLNGIQPVSERSSLRVIVFFSDGAPNTFSSQFKFNPNTDCVNSVSKFRLPGGLSSGDASSGTINGLWRIDDEDTPLPGSKCSISGGGGSGVLAIDALPTWYNAHPDPTTNANIDEFRVVGGGPAPVTSAPTYKNVNWASRNLLEQMAAKARSEGIYVLTLGLGDNLLSKEGPQPSDRGEDLLKCMANTVDALARCKTAGAGQPIGIYCHASTSDELKPCFDKLASAIMRISQ